MLNLAAYVEAAIHGAVEALCKGRLDLVDAVTAEEEEIDRWEVRIEEECLRVLALYGLVASDLRRVVAALRINRDLEGLADVAENLAKRARKIARDPSSAPHLPRLCALADASLAVVDQALNALASLDTDLARTVVLADHPVGPLRGQLVSELKLAVRNEPEKVTAWLRLINSARNLERAVEHAQSIGSAIVYLKDGVNVRRHDDGQGDED
jgi:phosphate transport system protein